MIHFFSRFWKQAIITMLLCFYASASVCSVERELSEVVWFSLAELAPEKISNGFELAVSSVIVPLLLPPHLVGRFIQNGNRTQNNRHADITNSQSLKVDSRWIFHVCFVLRKVFSSSPSFCDVSFSLARCIHCNPFHFFLLLLNIANCFMYNCTFGQDIHGMWNFSTSDTFFVFFSLVLYH